MIVEAEARVMSEAMTAKECIKSRQARKDPSHSFQRKHGLVATFLLGFWLPT